MFVKLQGHGNKLSQFDEEPMQKEEITWTEKTLERLQSHNPFQ